MARTIPKSINDRLNFFRTHIERWEVDPSEIGLTPTEVAALRAAFDAMVAANTAAQVARQAAEMATQDQTFKMAALVEMGSVLISKVRAFAEAGDERNAVLNAASLQPPPPATFTQIAPPSPDDFRCAPKHDGTIKLSWTSDLKRTSFYRLEREVTQSGRTTRTFLDGVRSNTYIDDTLPVGFTHVRYLLTPIHQRRNAPPNIGAARGAEYTPGRVWPRAATPTTTALAA